MLSSLVYLPLQLFIKFNLKLGGFIMAQSASQAITGNNSFQQSIYVSSSDDLINLPVGINAVTINKNISTWKILSLQVTI